LIIGTLVNGACLFLNALICERVQYSCHDYKHLTEGDSSSLWPFNPLQVLFNNIPQTWDLALYWIYWLESVSFLWAIDWSKNNSP